MSLTHTLSKRKRARARHKVAKEIDRLVLKDEHGAELLTMRAIDGVVTAEYAEDDLDEAAKRLVEIVRWVCR